MIMTAIASETIYIKKLIRVIKSAIPRNTRNLHVNGRCSDAFIYILDGRCHYQLEDQTEFSVMPGDILYLASNSKYRLNVGDEDYHFIYCDFEFDDESARQSAVYRPKNKLDAANIFEKIYRDYTRPNVNSFFDCMSDLYRIYSLIVMTAGSEYMTRSQREIMSEMAMYMACRISDRSLSVSELARRAGVSEVYFRKKFKEYFGTTPAKYLMNLRVEKARELLLYSFITLEQCAQICGFSSPQYFCHVFKQLTGMPPAAYRAEIQNRA